MELRDYDLEILDSKINNLNGRIRKAEKFSREILIEIQDLRNRMIGLDQWSLRIEKATNSNESLNTIVILKDQLIKMKEDLNFCCYCGLDVRTNWISGMKDFKFCRTCFNGIEKKRKMEIQPEPKL